MFSELLRASGHFSSVRTSAPQTLEPFLASNQETLFKAKKSKAMPDALGPRWSPHHLLQPAVSMAEAQREPQRIRSPCQPAGSVCTGAPSPAVGARGGGAPNRTPSTPGLPLSVPKGGLFPLTVVTLVLLPWGQDGHMSGATEGM